jgi:Fe2+ or Zn2+ uptake regulation protein
VPTSAELHQTVSQRLARNGQRYTANKRRLVDVLAGAEHPLTIPDILATCDLAQSSVYRNLSDLERAGAVGRLVTNDEWSRYELAEDLTGHHHHLVCSTCGAVRDVVVPEQLEHTLDAELTNLATDQGFVLDHHRLDLVGTCGTCAAP